MPRSRFKSWKRCSRWFGVRYLTGEAGPALRLSHGYRLELPAKITERDRCRQHSPSPARTLGLRLSRMVERGPTVFAAINSTRRHAPSPRLAAPTHQPQAGGPTGAQILPALPPTNIFVSQYSCGDPMRRKARGGSTGSKPHVGPPPRRSTDLVNQSQPYHFTALYPPLCCRYLAKEQRHVSACGGHIIMGAYNVDAHCRC
jgi:hypothetical protein